MKAKIFSIICMLTLFVIEVTAQSVTLTPTVVPAQGGTNSSGNMTVTYTIGQPTMSTLANGNLLLTQGFQQPIIPLPPVAPPAQSVCSDSPLVFTLNNVLTGFTGNQIEWSLDSTFDSSTIMASPGAITVTVSPGNKIFVWIRSRDNTSEVVSQAVYTTLEVKSLPAAIITPADTSVNNGDTLFLEASGGVSYYWPQYDLTSPNIMIIVVNQEEDYVVNVTGVNGCEKDAHSRRQIRFESGAAQVYPSLTVTEPISGNLVTNSTIVACHDYLTLTTLCEYNPGNDFTIVQTLPAGITADASTLTVAPTTTNSVIAVPATGTGIVTAVVASNVITWTIPGSYAATNNFNLQAILYVGCNASAAALSIKTEVQVSNVDVPCTCSADISGYTIVVPKITPSVVNLLGAGEDVSDYEELEFCASASNAPVYGFNITTSAPNNELYLSGTSNFVTSVTATPSYGSTFTLDETELNNAIGQKFITNTGCVYVKTDNINTGCSGYSESYGWTIDCNTDFLGGKDTTICTPANNSVTDDISVTSGANLQISLQLYQSGNVSKIDPCDAFSVIYTIKNPGNNNLTLQNLVFPFDVNWINTNNPGFIASMVNGSYNNNSITPSTLPPGNVSVDISALPSAASTLTAQATCTIQINNLQINVNTDGTMGPECTVSTNSNIISEASVSFLDPCNASGTSYSNAASAYSNSFAIVPNDYAKVNGSNNIQVSPGDQPMLYFSCPQNPVNADPLGYANGVGQAHNLFGCTSYIYQATVTFDPSLISLAGSSPYYLYYKDGNSQAVGYELSPTGVAGVYTTTFTGLTAFGNNVLLYFQAQLAPNCPGTYTGGQTIPTITLSETCNESGCSMPYCFASLPNALDVHCGGICNQTGIGTTSLNIANLSAPGAQNAYACDMIDFTAIGQGFNGSALVPPGATTNVFLNLTYPDVLNIQNKIFDFTQAQATYVIGNGTPFTGTYPFGSSTSVALVSGPAYTPPGQGQLVGSWSCTVAITATSPNQCYDCQDIRSADDYFAIDLQVPVECDLPYQSATQGVYPMQGIDAQMEFYLNYNNTASYSCDSKDADFTFTAHTYGSNAVYQPSIPCNESILITDSAINGEPSGYEMPANQMRQLVEWPVYTGITGDPAITLTYPNSMSIPTTGGITYSDDIGTTGTVLYSSPVPNGGNYVVTVYGLDNGNGGYYWPMYSKDGPKVYHSLLVQFNQSSCTNHPIVVHLPHKLHDGRPVGSCTSSSCGSWTNFDYTPTQPSTANNISITPANNVIGINPLLTMDPFTVNYTLNNPNNIPPGSIYLAPQIATGPAITVPTLVLASPTTNFPVVNPYPATPVYTAFPTSLSSNNLVFDVTLNQCTNQTINLPIGYACAANVTNSSSFCGDNIDASIIVKKVDPSVTITPQTANYVADFPDCKGVCNDDILPWVIEIKNTGGPAYKPTLLLNNNGPGDIDIYDVSYQYVGANGTLATGYVPPVSYFRDNLTDYFTEITSLPHDNSQNAYLAPGDEIIATIRVYGDGQNCSAVATLQALLAYEDVCLSTPATSPAKATQNFTFESSPCTPFTCSTEADAGIISGCLPCDFGPAEGLGATIIEPSCGGGSGGSITLLPTGGPLVNTGGSVSAGSFTFLWGDNSTSSSKTNLAAGTYTVTATNNNCSETATYQLTNSGLTIDAAISPANCNNTGGAVQISVTGCSGNYSYNWSNGATSASIYNLPSGSYDLTVNCSPTVSGCMAATYNAVITQPALVLGLDPLQVSDVDCGSATGSVAVTGIYNIYEGVNYLWSNGQTSSQITNLAAGTYTVTVTDFSYCEATASATVATLPNTAEIGPNPSVGATTGCGSAEIGVYAISFAGQNCDITYTITGQPATTAYNVPFTNGTGEFDLSGLTTGTNTITINSIALHSNNGCSANAPANVSTQFTITGAPGLTITGEPLNNHICITQGGTFTLNGLVTGDNIDAHYTWSESDNSAQYNMQSNTYTDPTVAGSVTYTVSYNDGLANSCTVSATTTITFDYSVSATIAPVKICSSPANNVPFNCTATGGTQTFTYTWAPTNNNAAAVDYNGVLANHTYKVTVEDQNTCSATASVTVGIDNLSVMINPGSQVVCSGGQFVFTATATNTSTYNWSGNGTPVLPASFETAVLTSTSDYSVIATDGYGCTASASVTATVDNLNLTVNALPGSGCVGGSATANVTGGIGSGQDYYSWSNAQTSTTLTNLGNGTYTVTVTDGSNCTATGSGVVSGAPNAISVALTLRPAFCGSNYASISTTVSGGAGNYSYGYAWSNGSSASIIQYLLPTLTSQTVSLTVTDDNCCSTSASIDVVAPVSLTAQAVATAASTCGGTGGKVLGIVGGGLPPFAYNWSNGAVTQNLPNVSAGNYALTLTDHMGCSATAMASVSDAGADFQISVTAAASSPIYCNTFNQLPTVTGVGGNGSYTYTWAIGNTAISNPTASNFAPGDYELTVTDGSGCSVVANYNLVPVYPDVELSVTPVACYGGSTGAATVINPGSNLGYAWSNGALGRNDFNLATNTYYVTVTDKVTSCTSFGQAVVTGPGEPLEANKTEDPTTCGIANNGSIIVTGYNGEPCYTWSLAGQTSITGKSATFSGLAAGNYTVTLTDNAGCSMTIADEVTTTTPVEIHQVEKSNPCGVSNTGLIKLDLYYGYAPVSYTWSPAGPNSNIDPNLPAGTYNVTVTDGNGCTVSASVVLTETEPTACIFGVPVTTYTEAADNDPNAIATPLPNGFGGAVIVGHNSTLTINQDMNFNGHEIVMGNNSKIVINGANVQMQGGTSVHGCCALWDGIYVNSGSTLDFGGNLSDARNGIVVQEGASSIDIIGSDFRDNVINVQLNNLYSVASSPHTATSYEICANSFRGQDYLLPLILPPPPPFTLQIPIISSNAYAGIIINNSSTINIPNPNYTGNTYGYSASAPNTFDKLNCGIDINNSVVNVNANTFTNIQNYSNPPAHPNLLQIGHQPYFGSAVYSTSTGNNVSNVTVQTYTGNNILNATPTFQGCTYAVNASRSVLNVTTNPMLNVTYGVNAQNCVNTLMVTGNYINNTNFGVTLNSNSSTLMQIVEANVINVNPPYGLTVVPTPVFCHNCQQLPLPNNTYGIAQTDAGVQHWSWIWANSIVGGRNCIQLNNCYGTRAQLNYLYQTGSQAVYGSQSCIYASNCTNVSIDGNFMYGNSASYITPYNLFSTSSTRKSGITLYEDVSGEVCSNSMGNIYNGGYSPLGYGLNIIGNCASPTPVSITQNMMYSNYYGMVLQTAGTNLVLPSAMGSTSTTLGNKFYGDNSGNFASTKRTTTFGNASATKFYYMLADENPLPSGTSVISSQSITSGSEEGCMNEIEFLRPPHNNGYNQLKSDFNDAIANGETEILLQSNYTTTGPWLLKRKLYRSICDTGTAVSMRNRIPSQFITALGQFIDTVSDSTMLPVAADIYNQLTGKTNEEIVDSSALSDSSLAGFFSTMQSSDFNAIQAYTNQLSILLHDSTGDTTTYNSDWQSAASLNAAIPEANTQALNFKTIQSIYLNTVSLNDTTVVDSSTLSLILNIAIQCPYVAGDAVYYARALYAQYVDTIFFDDLIICQTDSNSDRMLQILRTDTATVAKENNNEFVKVFPNPAHELLNLAYNALTEGNIFFELSDQLGRVVMSHQLATEKFIASFSTNNLSSGLYYWQLKDSQRIIKCGKVIIIQ